MKKRWILLLLIGALLMSACSKTPEEVETPAETPSEAGDSLWNEEYVAKVGEEYLLRKTYNALLALNKYIFISQYGEEAFSENEEEIIETLRQATIDDYVMGAQVENLAQDRGVSPDEELLKNLEAELKTSFEQDNDLAVFFEGEGVESKDLLPFFQLQVKISGLTESLKEEVMKSEEYQEALEKTELVHARHILVDGEDEEGANKLFEEVKENPETFEDVAKEKSQDPGSGSRGGDLGYFSAIDMVPEFSKASFEAKIGEIVMTKSQFGYHIIEVLDKGTLSELEAAGKSEEVAQSKAQVLEVMLSTLFDQEYGRMLEKYPVEYYALEKEEE